MRLRQWIANQPGPWRLVAPIVCLALLIAATSFFLPDAEPVLAPEREALLAIGRSGAKVASFKGPRRSIPAELEDWLPRPLSASLAGEQQWFSIELRGEQISEANLRLLGAIKRPFSVVLSGSVPADAPLELLRDMPWLHCVDDTDAQIPTATVRRLEAYLPKGDVR